jgi:flagellar protein FliO/FliZ
MTTSILPSIFALLFVLGLIPLCLWVLKQSKGLGNWSVKTKNPLVLSHRLQVGPREQIAVLQVAGKTLIVGITAQSIQTLADFGDGYVDELAPSSQSERPSAFQTLFARMKNS